MTCFTSLSPPVMKRWFRCHRILRRQPPQRGEFVATSSPGKDRGSAATSDAVRTGDAHAATAVKQLYVLFFVKTEHWNKEQLMSRITYLAVCAALALATSACGDTPGQRALTGGAIGAGGGALVGAAAGSPLAGAVVGGLGGAAIGAATTPRY
jgi:hypothetical protein